MIDRLLLRSRTSKSGCCKLTRNKIRHRAVLLPLILKRSVRRRHPSTGEIVRHSRLQRKCGLAAAFERDCVPRLLPRPNSSRGGGRRCSCCRSRREKSWRGRCHVIQPRKRRSTLARGITVICCGYFCIHTYRCQLLVKCCQSEARIDRA